MERKEVDPAVDAAIRDLNLTRHDPAAARQPAVNSPSASGMYSVVLSPLRQENRRDCDELDPKPECLAEPVHEGQRWVGATGLHVGQIATRDANRVGDNLLGQVESQPRVPTDSAEFSPDRHAGIEHGGPLLAVM